MIAILCTFGAAFLFGWALLKLRIPGGMLVGAIVGAILYGILTGGAEIPVAAKWVAQAITGAFMGSSIHHKELQELPKLFAPIVIMLTSYLFINLAVGLLVWLVSPLDGITALFCAIPGGVGDIPMIADDVGAQTYAVTILQFGRMLVGVGIFPILIRLVCGSHTEETEHADTVQEGAEYPERNFPWPLALLVALAFSLLGRMSGLPGIGIISAVIPVTCLNIFVHPVQLPRWAKRIAQLCSGAYLGSCIGWSDLMQLRHLLLPLLLIIMAHVANCFIIAEILHRRYRFQRNTAMLIMTPAGASDMALIASDLGGFSSELVIMHLVRFIAVTTIFPQINQLVARLLP